MEQLRLFSRPSGPHCPPCPLRSICGSEFTDNACAPTLDLGGPAGPFALHPLRSDFDAHFARVGGAGFDDIAGRPLEAPALDPYLPQVKWLERLRRENWSEVDVPAVAVRVKEVFRGGRIRSAAELRAQVGLSADVPIVLLLHGKDELLELLDTAEVVSQIAAGGYALVTPPSYSTWEPRRRPDNLLSLRRSLLYYDGLAHAGAQVCLRVAWVERRDVERFAEWVVRYSVALVSLDLMTYEGRSFDRAIANLAYFDGLVAASCHYLVDGVRARRKIEALYLATAPERVTVSNATMAGPPPVVGGVVDDTFRGRTAVTALRCQEAREAVAAAHASSVETFIAATLEQTCQRRREWLDEAVLKLN
jgi:hypothetical protein